ncbi:MAG: OmpA family protein [Myxococcota bacterium]
MSRGITPASFPPSILAFVAMLLTACPGPEYPRCEKDAQCRGGEVCVFGECLTCALDSHCPSGQVCRGYKCITGGACNVHADCPTGTFCVAGRCSTECRTDADCPEHRACVDRRCTLKPGACDAHSDCPEGQFCHDNTCGPPAPGDPGYEGLTEPSFSRTELARADAGMPSGADAMGALDLCGQSTRVYFAFNEAGLTDETRDMLNKVAACLRSKPGQKFIIQGHADERGSTEYNLALGERRALAIKQFLVDLGVGAERMRVVSLGEERPLDEGHDEAAWAKNRRGELIPERQP